MPRLDKDAITGKFLPGNKAARIKDTSGVRRELLKYFRPEDWRDLYRKFMELMLDDDEKTSLAAFKLFHQYWVATPAEGESKEEELDPEVLKRLMNEREIA